MLVSGTVVLRPRRRRRVIKVNRYRDRMQNGVGPGVRNEAQMGSDQGRLDCQWHVEGSGVVQSEDRHPVRRRGRRLVEPGAVRHRRRTRLHPLRREPLLDRALELVVGRPVVPTGDASGSGRRAVRVGAVVAVVAHDRRRRHDRRSQQRALRIAERAHARARAVVRVAAVGLAYRRNTRVRVAGAVHRAVHHWQLGMREA